MDIVRRLLNWQTLKESDDCDFCQRKMERNTAHMLSNLVLQFGIATDRELREFSSRNCVAPADDGLPTWARDLMDFFMASFCLF
jgi:hypothetical protein